MATKPSKKQRTGFLASDIIEDARTFHNMLWGIGIHCTHIPVPTPVSLMRKHLGALEDQSYVVAEKNDGKRKQLLLGSTEDDGKPYAVFIDRAWNLDVQQHVEPRSAHEFFKKGDVFDGTLFDGEWMPEVNGWPTFVVFDAVAVCGYNMKKKPFMTRLAIARDTINGLEMKGVRLCVKAWHPVSETSTVWQRQKQADGLVFMPLSDPVQTGRHNRMFKYKTPDKHTLDFLYTPTGFVYGEGAGEKRSVSNVGVEVQNPCTIALNTGTVYECRPRDGGSTVFDVVAPREDKVAPNHGRTVTLTLTTIKEALSPAELSQHCTPKKK